MGGRHRARAPRPVGRALRRVLVAAVPVLTAAAAVTAVVLGGGILAGSATSADPRSGRDAVAVPTFADTVGPSAPPLLPRLPDPGAAAGAAGDAAHAAAVRAADDRRAAERRRAAEERAASSGDGVCDLAGPPRFDDPEHPNVITNRDCGHVDEQGRERSRDPWIDGRLRAGPGD